MDRGPVSMMTRQPAQILSSFMDSLFATLRVKGKNLRMLFRVRLAQRQKNVITFGSIVEQHGRLKVQGNQIVDQTGTPVRLRGVSLFWSQWMSQFWNEDVVHWLKNDWHATLIRASMGVEEGGYLENPAKEMAKVETVVKACITTGIYVIIDWHDHHASSHITSAQIFFSHMASKYGGYPNVMFEIFNEPIQEGWVDSIKPYHEMVVPHIRKHTENLIILGTREWSQDVDEASWNPVPGRNLAYTVHFYAASHGQYLRDKVSSALASGIAIFATEWGTCEASGNGRLDLHEAQNLLEFLQQNHISDAGRSVTKMRHARHLKLERAGPEVGVPTCSQSLVCSCGHRYEPPCRISRWVAPQRPRPLWSAPPLQEQC